MKLTSYWLDTSEPFTGAAPGAVQGSCPLVGAYYRIKDRFQ